MIVGPSRIQWGEKSFGKRRLTVSGLEKKMRSDFGPSFRRSLGLLGSRVDSKEFGVVAMWLYLHSVRSYASGWSLILGSPRMDGQRHRPSQRCH